ncbi:MAG: hypothetical protein NVS4B3_25660 [Gemmatimonadaceae bacterium]
MTLDLPGVVASLRHHASVLPDTIVLRQAIVARGTFEQVAAVASGLVSISVVVLTAGLVPAALAFRRRYKRVNDLLDRVYGDVQPLVHQARIVAENASVITTTLRADIATLSQTVGATSGAVTDLINRAEHRLTELDALLAVAQREAESFFISTASTVRGAHAGARAFREREPGMQSHQAKEASHEMEAERDDDDIEGTTQHRRAAPRIRPR